MAEDGDGATVAGSPSAISLGSALRSAWLAFATVRSPVAPGERTGLRRLLFGFRLLRAMIENGCGKSMLLLAVRH